MTLINSSCTDGAWATGFRSCWNFYRSSQRSNASSKILSHSDSLTSTSCWCSRLSGSNTPSNDWNVEDYECWTGEMWAVDEIQWWWLVIVKRESWPKNCTRPLIDRTLDIRRSDDQQTSIDGLIDLGKLGKPNLSVRCSIHHCCTPSWFSNWIFVTQYTLNLDQVSLLAVSRSLVIS